MNTVKETSDKKNERDFYFNSIFDYSISKKLDENAERVKDEERRRNLKKPLTVEEKHLACCKV